MRKKFIMLLMSAVLCLSAAISSAPVSAAPVGDGTSKTGIPALVDINQATLAELQAVPWIGPIRAQRIVAGRPYKAKTDLVRKKVMTKREYDLIKDKIVARHS